MFELIWGPQGEEFEVGENDGCKSSSQHKVSRVYGQQSNLASIRGGIDNTDSRLIICPGMNERHGDQRTLKFVSI
jgi:hypothetical protein